MKVECTIKTFADKWADRIDVKVISDGIWQDRVWIEIDGTRHCFIADELIKAIKNAQNHK